ncbi:MAG: iron-sulfur cluster assembly accessory protein [Candidatus Paracaedibacteraceae bacterium]|jgi:iron-sulfur cluster assembly protein|nr:iron-sulfur cluster assembly accessory protein [Candidatus Paracaedibacteraceae bacterium]
MRPTPLTMTESAKQRVRDLMSQRETPAVGIRIGIKTKGCSGMSYTMEFADQASPFDEVVTIDDITLMIDPKAIMFILGTEMDYIEETLHSGFVFNNPNEKGRCGCGKSFHV